MVYSCYWIAHYQIYIWKMEITLAVLVHLEKLPH